MRFPGQQQALTPLEMPSTDLDVRFNHELTPSPSKGTDLALKRSFDEYDL